MSFFFSSFLCPLEMTIGLTFGLRNYDLGASKPSKSLSDRTHIGPHQPLVSWIFWCLLPAGSNLGDHA